MRNLAEYNVTGVTLSPDKSHTGPQNWKLTLAYDGSDFNGWQVQPWVRTIQGELAAALERICGEQVLPQGSGRTDAGVHALAQVASFTLTVPIPAENLLRALRLTLPPAIQPLALLPVGPGFHARHSAIRKTYEYRIWRSDSCSPFLARYVAPCGHTLNTESMQQAAQAFLGEHDFTSFAACDPDLATRESDAKEPKSAVRTIFHSAIEERDNVLIYRVTGSGFLHRMVRIIVGTLVDVGRGRTAPTAISEILNARSRAAAGPSATAKGLFLVSVEYPPA